MAFVGSIRNWLGVWSVIDERTSLRQTRRDFYRDARVCPNADKIEQIGLSEMFRYRNIVPSQRTGIVRWLAGSVEEASGEGREERLLFLFLRLLISRF
jgi:hypothetical protein